MKKYLYSSDFETKFALSELVGSWFALDFNYSEFAFPDFWKSENQLEIVCISSNQEKVKRDPIPLDSRVKILPQIKG